MTAWPLVKEPICRGAPKTMPPIKLKRRPLLIRLRNHYEIARQTGLNRLEALRAAWFIATA